MKMSSLFSVFFHTRDFTPASCKSYLTPRNQRPTPRKQRLAPRTPQTGPRTPQTMPRTPHIRKTCP